MTHEPWRWFLSLWLLFLLLSRTYVAARWAALALAILIGVGTFLHLSMSMAALRKHYRDHGIHREDPGNV